MGDKAKILVVDDDPNDLLATARLLKETSYEVLTASSGKETLKVVGKDHPDLVLLDVVLPDADGIEVCKIASGSTRPCSTMIGTYLEQ